LTKSGIQLDHADIADLVDWPAQSRQQIKRSVVLGFLLGPGMSSHRQF
jgi:hypothetical protein